MIQPGSSPQPVPSAMARRGQRVIGLAAGLVTFALVAGAVALWSHFGTTVFFETIVSGLEACF